MILLWMGTLSKDVKNEIFRKVIQRLFSLTTFRGERKKKGW